MADGLRSSLRTGIPAAAAGVLGTLAGLAAAHLTAAVTDPATSPVVSVGSTVIDLTPTPVKEWAISTFGTADKPILLGSVVAGTLVLAGIAGVLARRRFALGAGLLVLLTGLAGAAALARPTASLVDAVPAVVAAVVGVLALAVIIRPSRGPDATAAGPRLSRRDLLGVGAGALVVAVAGEWVARARTRIADITLPQAARRTRPLPAGLDERHPGITPLRTATADFYRVDTRLTLPIVDVDSWTLTIDGDVDRELTFTFDDLMRMPLEEHDITMTCVSNDVGGRYVGGARWLGVPLVRLLGQAGIRDAADQILSTDVDGFTISTPLEVATDGRNAMVVVGMNGEPLPREHGFPCRLITPGLYGFVGATKWLTRLTLTTYAERSAYWTQRDWAVDAPIKVSSRIDTPKPLARVKPGRTAIGGVAWAQTRGIKSVEVRIDGGAWQRAELGPEVNVDYWRQWYLAWEAPVGTHLLAVRATTQDGDVQSPARATPFPAGSNGIQEVTVFVE
ncbi:molybdopterin-dependent oxidoreductase [Nocardioides sp. LHG3406-4]|uniref:molybdopterin-dependent oxidoreductase n=1 Tax=Nocardioides sp. LHG3406-4 TaxID=2804575 RepID=UPI003CF56DD6